MKKILALALCAIMMVAMMSSVSAVDYVLDYNFEDDFEGEFIAIDNSIKFYKKQFKADVVKFDGTMCMKLDRTGYVKENGDADNYCDVLAGGTTAAWGLDGTWVFSYDLYLEKVESTEGSTPCWQVGMLRMAAPAGTQFQQSSTIMGNKLCQYNNGDEICEVPVGKWFNIATVFDMKNKCFSTYLDGVLVSDSLDWNCSDTSATEATQVRCAWSGQGDNTYEGIAYVDNFKAYVADKPENATGAKLETTTAAPETAAPETTAAPAATQAATQAPAVVAPVTPAAPTADIAVVLAAVSAIAASGVVVFKKRH